jgi:hypothetical protein
MVSIFTGEDHKKQLVVFRSSNIITNNFSLLWGRYNSKDRYEQSESNKNSKTSKVNY